MIHHVNKSSKPSHKMVIKVSHICSVLAVLSLALAVSGNRFNDARSFKLAHATLSIHSSSFSKAIEHDSHTEAAAAAAAAAAASSEETEAISDYIFRKSKFTLHGSHSTATPASAFSIRSLGAKRKDKQYFVHFSTLCDVGTLLALHKFTGRHVIAHIDGGLYVAIGGQGFAAKARRFPGVSWVQEREPSSKLSTDLQQILKKTAVGVKEQTTHGQLGGGDRAALTEVIAECWYDGCAAAASAVKSVCPDVYQHPTLVEVHCPAHSLHGAVSVLSEHVGVDHVDIKPVVQFSNFGSRAILGTGPSATSPNQSLVLSRIDVSNSIIGVADSGIDMNNCFFYDDSSSSPWQNSRVVHTYEVQPCSKCGRCCSSNSGPQCSNELNTCGNFKDENGHGTHVAGTIAGSGPGSVTYGDGIAAGAKIFFQDTLNIVNASVCYSSNAKKCLANSQPTDLLDLFAPAYNAGVRVHSNSWAISNSLGWYHHASRAVDAFTSDHPTFLVLFAGGNFGYQKLNSVTAPGTCKNCLAVGATQQSDSLFRSMHPFVDGGDFCEVKEVSDECCGNSLSCINRCCHWASVLQLSLTCCPNKPTCSKSGNVIECPIENERLRSAFNIASYSSRGPVFDGRFKPDVVAPGEHLSASAPSQRNPDAFKLTAPNYCSVPDNTRVRTPYENFNSALQFMYGTSMATPLLAGGVEKIRQYFVQGYYPLGVRATGSHFEPAEALVRAVVLASCSSVYHNRSWGVLTQSSTDDGYKRRGLTWQPLSHIPEYNPEFFQGFGLPVLDHAVYMAESSNGYRMFFTNGTYSPSSPATAYNIPCSPSAAIPLTLTLVWTDPPSNTNSQKQLVNDLDLIVVVPGSPSSQIFGNMRNFADSTNTVERVVTKCPSAGFVTAVVGFEDSLKTSSQAWYLVANGPVNSGFSPTSLPLYSHGRYLGAVTQDQPCTGDTLEATVSFKLLFGHSCVGKSIAQWNIAANEECELLVFQFRSSLAQMLGIPVQGFEARIESYQRGTEPYSYTHYRIRMNFQCSFFVNSLGGGLSMKYVAPGAQVVALQNLYANANDPLSKGVLFFSDIALNSFDWSTFALNPRITRIVNRMFLYSDTQCSVPTGNSLANGATLSVNPVLMSNNLCTGGTFTNTDGIDLFMKVSACRTLVDQIYLDVDVYVDNQCAKRLGTLQLKNGTCLPGNSFGLGQLLPATDEGIASSMHVCSNDYIAVPTFPSSTTTIAPSAAEHTDHPTTSVPTNPASDKVSVVFYTDNVCASPLSTLFSSFMVDVNACVMNPFTVGTTWVKFSSCSIGDGAVFQMFADDSCSNPVSAQPIVVPTGVCAFGSIVPGSLSSRFCCGLAPCDPIAPTLQPNVSIIATAYTDASCGMHSHNFSGAPNPLVVSSDTCSRGPAIEGSTMSEDASYFVKAVSCGVNAIIALYLDASCVHFQALVDTSSGICSGQSLHPGVSSFKYECPAHLHSLPSTTLDTSAPAHGPSGTSQPQSQSLPGSSATISTPVPGPHTAAQSAESKNKFKLSFEIGHLCPSNSSVTRSCLLNNEHTFISSQFFHLAPFFIFRQFLLHFLLQA
jgi:subtilisin family serine protease